MKSIVTASFLVVSFAFSVQAVHAMACQGVDEHGHCLDATTVEWCDNGVLQTATCPDNEICAKHKDHGEGYLCIAKELTNCAGIPDGGYCPVPNQAIWCVEGELATKKCASGELCGHDSDNGWVDCIPEGELGADAGALPPSSSEPEDFEGDAGGGEAISPDDASSETADASAPIPNVTEGKPWKVDSQEGCQSARDTSPAMAMLVFLILLGLSRKRLVR